MIWVVFLAVWGPPGSELCDMTSGVVGGVGGSRKIAHMRVRTEDFGILHTDIRMYRQMDRISPRSKGLCPLSWSLPKKLRPYRFASLMQSRLAESLKNVKNWIFCHFTKKE